MSDDLHPLVRLAVERAGVEVRKGKRSLTDDEAAPVLAVSFDDEEEQTTVTPIFKADDEKRYALAPLYLPGTHDAHGETIEADVLEKATWDYFRRGDFRLRLQHNRDIVAGEVVGLLALPFSVEVDATLGKSSKKLKLPAGTVLMGALFTEDTWPLVKSGKLAGWSLGGRAKRVRGDETLETPEEQRGKFARLVTDI